MTVIAHSNLMDGSKGKEGQKSWETRQQVIVLENVSTTGDVLVNALADSNVPDMGEAHPNITGLVVVGRSPEAIGRKGTVKVTVEYGLSEGSNVPPTGSEITVGTTLISSSVNTDISGNLMTVKYVKDANYTPPAVNTVEQSGTATILLPQTTITYTQKENTIPLTKSQTYVGTLNNATWQGGATGTWLCTGIVGKSSNSGTTWAVTYTFQYNKDTWKFKAVYTDKETGKPPADMDKTEGIKLYNVYSSVSWTSIFS